MTANDRNEKVNLEALAKMTGFPVDLIKDEIFHGQAGDSEVSLDDLRNAMLSYIDSTMLLVGEKK